MRSLNNHNELKVSNVKKKKKSVKANLPTLLKHYIENFEDRVYAMVRFFDPKNWTDEKNY